jgi:hypothetical protein
MSIGGVGSLENVYVYNKQAAVQFSRSFLGRITCKKAE